MNIENSLIEMQQDLPQMSTEQLEEMFSQNMRLTDDFCPGSSQAILPAPAVKQVEQQQPPIKYSISQHYTHSAHVVRGLHPLQPSNEDVATRMLIKHGIAPSSLLRAQLNLFEQADDEQRARLIELWTIVPPMYARNGGQDSADRVGEYQSTTLAQEQELALLNYQKNNLERNVQSDVQAERSPPMDFFMQPSGEGLQRTINQYFSEASGQSLAGNGSWSEHLNQQQMEHQYGNFDEEQRHNGRVQEIIVKDDTEDEEML